MKLLRVYSEPDKDEVFNAISWSYDSTGPILSAAGVKGVIRVIVCNGQPMSSYKNLVGHSKCKYSMQQARFSLTFSFSRSGQ